MAREIINVGATPNDGEGDPIRTAFIKTNNNFGELYSRVQVEPPIALTGSVGDTAGMTAYDSEYYYYCFGNYDGSTEIWNQVPNAAQANVTALSATGNITADYFFGDGSQLTGVEVASIQNGNSNVQVYANSNVATSVNGTANVMVVTPTLVVITGDLSVSGNASLTGNIVGDRITNGTTGIEIQTFSGNANVSVAGTSNVAVFAPTGQYVTGVVSATGNITGNYFVGNGSQLTDIIATSLGTLASLSVSGNTTTGNLLTGGLISATGNITGGNVSGTNLTGTLTTAAQTNITSVGTLGSVSVTGNITAGNISATNYTGTTVSVSGNTTAGNILTSGLISATGNITGGNVSATVFYGSGAGLTNIAVAGGTQIVNGTSNVSAGASSNVTVGVAGTSDVVVWATTGEYVTGVVSATGNITGGNVSGTNLTGTLTTAAQTNITSVGTLSLLSVTGNTSSGNLLTNGIVSATGNVYGANFIGNVTPPPGGAISTTGNVSGDILSATGNVIATYFVGTATESQYADVAENYTADADYEPGTVLEFGGNKEVTIASDETPRVAGIVSSNPAHLMNSMLNSEYIVPVALIGRVPCKVRGAIAKGDMLISAGDGYARAKQNPIMGTVIGKALEASTGDHSIIEVVVGRL